MDLLTLPNLLAWTLQTAGIVLLATGLMAAARIDAPGVRYTFWRGVLALCLALPLLQNRQLAPARTATVETTITSTALAAGGPARQIPDWTLIALAVIAAGMTVRLGWLGVNAMRLRRLRRRATLADAGAIHADLQALIGVRCEVRYVARLRQPVTFGVLRPVILLPEPLRAAAPDVQRAVISHELFHVKRRDWAWLVAEELVCAALWFNPAIWWTVARIHDARELVVDELAVLATGRRRAYVEALMAFADETSLAPVAAFGGRGRLFHRIVQLSQERVMSSHRLVLTCGVVAAVLSAGAWQVVAAFPLTAHVQPQQQQEQEAAGQVASAQRASETRDQVSPEGALRVGGAVKTPKKIRDVRPEYPAEARAAGVSGVVILEIRIGPEGEVEDAAVLRSIPMLDDAALDAVRQWAFTPTLLNGQPVPVIMTITVNFTLDAEAMPKAASPASASTKTASPKAAAPAAGGGRVTAAAAAEPATVQKPGRPGPKVVHEVKPRYPLEAMAAKISGTVEVEATVGTDGTVTDVRMLRSIPGLDEAAMEAVRQWRFEPPAQPVAVQIEMTFKQK